jgi:hypothetical protein
MLTHRAKMQDLAGSELPNRSCASDLLCSC